MTIDEVIEIIKSKNVPYYFYSYGKENRSAECIVVEKREQSWIVYIWERGHEVTPELFLSEDAAAKYFLGQVLNLVS